jgi:hypothetical protein
MKMNEALKIMLRNKIKKQLIVEKKIWVDLTKFFYIRFFESAPPRPLQLRRYSTF